MTTSYDANSIEQFEGRDHIRTRPGMYISSTASEGLMHLLWEALDNAVDEHMVGHGNLITITLKADGGIQVEDSGRGIPTGINDKTGRSALAMVFEPNSGGKFNQDAYSISGGLNGVGISVIAALSSRATCHVYRDGKEFTIEFKQGKEGIFEGEGEAAPFTLKAGISQRKDPRSSGEKKARPTGTTILFYPDFEIFDTEEEGVEKAHLDLQKILSRAKNTCYLCPQLTIEVKDELFTQETYTYHYPQGFRDMLTDMSETPVIGEPIIFSGKSSFQTKGREREVLYDVAMQWEQGFATHTKSFVNTIETALGGTHVTGTHKGIEEAVLEAIVSKGIAKAKDPIPELIDILEGLNLVVNVKFANPGYSAQTKERLTEAAINTVTRKAVKDNLGEWFTARKNNTDAREILEKIIKAARTRKNRNAQFDVSDVMAEVNKEAVFSQKPENLKDCLLVGDPRSSLMLVEGASALGSILAARSAELQAVYPLKGKPLNVYGLSPERLFIPPNITNPRTPQEKRREAQRKTFLDAGHILLQNKELDDLVKIIGAGFGESFDITKMRYHDILIANDADPDGAHIASLLGCFFFLYMRPLVEEGRLYFTMPPLFAIKVGKESDPEMYYAANEREKEAVLAELKKSHKKVLQVGRRKGLGEMADDEVAEFLLNPETRRMKQITIEDSQAAANMLELTMGSDANARREWISNPKTHLLVNEED